ncbi:MAG: DUF92 domain-containing protein [Euryarchaeota archaeon]|nr:DUF92 domain-containing protein [Euryarchaeota archaeon]
MIDPTTLILLAAVTGSVCYAYIKEKIDTSSIVSTGIIGILCFYAGGDKWILPLLIFFVGGSLASHYNTAVKRELGVEQSIRTWKNVFANGGAAAVFALLEILSGNEMYFFGLMGAMAAALADTSATELGQVHGKNPRLIVNLKRVPVGTPGAVSKEGILFSLLGSGIISLLLFLWECSWLMFAAVLVSGFLGSLLDSLLGSTLEARGYMNTHMVNFAATLAAGLIVLMLILA